MLVGGLQDVVLPSSKAEWLCNIVALHKQLQQLHTSFDEYWMLTSNTLG